MSLLLQLDSKQPLRDVCGFGHAWCCCYHCARPRLSAGLQITDEGGGIPRSGVPKIFTYLYSTADSPLDALNAAGEGEDSPGVLAGYGYGLPLSRLYARYFGGDLQVRSNSVCLCQCKRNGRVIAL